MIRTVLGKKIAPGINLLRSISFELWPMYGYNVLPTAATASFFRKIAVAAVAWPFFPTGVPEILAYLPPAFIPPEPLTAKAIFGEI